MPLIATYFAAHPMTEHGEKWSRQALDRCTRLSVDVHEILARSAGGDILDEKGLLCVCRSCHQFIGDRPRLALAIGLRKSRYNRGTEGSSPATS